MIDKLLEAKKISRFEYLVFALFECNELGREFFDNMLINTFMEEPITMEDGGIKLAVLDGKRAVFREIRSALINVRNELRKIDNDNGSK